MNFFIDQVLATTVDDIAVRIYEQTFGEPGAEVSKGWAEGPFSEEELAAL